MIPVALEAELNTPASDAVTMSCSTPEIREIDWRSNRNGFAPEIVPPRKVDWSCKIKLKHKSDFWTWGYAKYFSLLSRHNKKGFEIEIDIETEFDIEIEIALNFKGIDHVVNGIDQIVNNWNWVTLKLKLTK